MRRTLEAQSRIVLQDAQNLDGHEGRADDAHHTDYSPPVPQDVLGHRGQCEAHSHDNCQRHQNTGGEREPRGVCTAAVVLLGVGLLLPVAEISTVKLCKFTNCLVGSFACVVVSSRGAASLFCGVRGAACQGGA